MKDTPAETLVTGPKMMDLRASLIKRDTPAKFFANATVPAKGRDFYMVSSLVKTCECDSPECFKALLPVMPELFWSRKDNVELLLSAVTSPRMVRLVEEQVALNIAANPGGPPRDIHFFEDFGICEGPLLAAICNAKFPDGRPLACPSEELVHNAATRTNLCLMKVIFSIGNIPDGLEGMDDDYRAAVNACLSTACHYKNQTVIDLIMRRNLGSYCSECRKPAREAHGDLRAAVKRIMETREAEAPKKKKKKGPKRTTSHRKKH